MANQIEANSIDRIETTPPSGGTHAPSMAQHLPRMHEGSDKIERGVDLLAIAEILQEVGPPQSHNVGLQAP